MTLTDGQKIAKKLASGISKEMRRIRTLLDECNAVNSQIQDCVPYTITKVSSPDSDFWKQKERVNTATIERGILWTVQRNIAQAFLLMKRSSEEMVLLKEDMQRVQLYWAKRQKYIQNQINSLSDETFYNQGLRSLLRKAMWETEYNLEKSKILFSSLSAETDDESVFPDDNDDFYSDSNSSSDDEY